MTDNQFYIDKLHARIETLEAELHETMGCCELAIKHRDAAEAEVSLWKSRVNEGADIIEGNVARINQLEAVLRATIAWTTEIRRSVDHVLDQKDAGIGCGKSVIEPWAPEQDK